jgi:hypothetical protein
VRQHFLISTTDKRHDRAETGFPFHCLIACGRPEGGCSRFGIPSRDCNSE